jgi:multimeric flavodoxin WrbA
MKKKIVGLSCGRKNGNCEIFLKTALMEVEKHGIETEILRLMDYKVLPCDGCKPVNAPKTMLILSLKKRCSRTALSLSRHRFIMSEQAAI